MEFTANNMKLNIIQSMSNEAIRIDFTFDYHNARNLTNSELLDVVSAKTQNACEILKQLFTNESDLSVSTDDNNN